MSGIAAVVDTCIFVAAKSPGEPEHDACERVLEMAHRHRFRALVSTIAVSEMLAGYYAEGDEAGAGAFLDYLRSTPAFETVPVDLSVAELGARVRAAKTLLLPDALIVATGMVGGAQFVVTHDHEFRKASGLLPTVSAEELVDRLERGSAAPRTDRPS